MQVEDVKLKFTKTVTRATFNNYGICVWYVESDHYIAQNHFNNINKYYTLMYLRYLSFGVTHSFVGYGLPYRYRKGLQHSYLSLGNGVSSIQGLGQCVT